MALVFSSIAPNFLFINLHNSYTKASLGGGGFKSPFEYYSHDSTCALYDSTHKLF